jgi:hypothetical protein
MSRLGDALTEVRSEVMGRRGLGLTKLYSLVNDPRVGPGDDADIDSLRQIHADVNKATLACYRWEDLDLDQGFHDYRGVTRWMISPLPRGEILDRLLEENHRRAALERETERAVKSKKRDASSSPSQEESLF